MKTYQQFKEEAEKNILHYLPENYENAEVGINQILKNNDTVKEALVIKCPSQPIAAQIYLDGYYEDYIHNGSVDQALHKMAGIVLEAEKEVPLIDTEQILNYEEARERVVLQVINEDGNKGRLQGIPAKKIADTDLTAVFRIMMDTPNGQGSVLVSQKIMEQWNVDLEGLYEKALENTQRENPFIIRSLLSVIMPCMTDRTSEAEANQLPKQLEGYMQYMLSNTSYVNGAATMLYPHLLEEIGKRFDSNFFILPSGIHEILLMKDTGEMSAVELQCMVMEINQTQVEPEEVLSNQVFSYDYKENKLTMATTREETEELLKQCSCLCDAGAFEEEVEWEREE